MRRKSKPANETIINDALTMCKNINIEPTLDTLKDFTNLPIDCISKHINKSKPKPIDKSIEDNFRKTIEEMEKQQLISIIMDNFEGLSKRKNHPKQKIHLPTDSAYGKYSRLNWIETKQKDSGFVDWLINQEKNSTTPNISLLNMLKSL